MIAAGRAKRVIASAAGLLVSCTTCGAGPEPVEGAYHGTVVDAETAAPIEGAVIVAEWFGCARLSMDGCGQAHVREVVTDSSGSFSMDARPPVLRNPFYYYRSSRPLLLLVYALDHLPVSSHDPASIQRSMAGTSIAGFEYALREGIRIPLAKPDDEDQLMESPFNYVDAKTPLLQRAIDEQRARLKRR